MAMTNEELESTYQALAERLTQIERKLAKVVTLTQLTQHSVFVENELKELTETVESLAGRMLTLEGTVKDIV